MTDPIDHNRRAWDARVRRGQRFARPLSEEELDDPAAAIDAWAASFGVAGRRVLCLGAGGGRQGPLYASAGGVVTVVDISEAQLEIDRTVAAERGLDLRTLAASMDDLTALGDAAFDAVIQPVSTCYVPDIAAVYREVARVLRPGGLYVSQHKQPASLQADVRRGRRGYGLIEPYYRAGPLPPVEGSAHRESGTSEFLHRWEQLIGGLCRAGFVLDDLSEPDHADLAARPGSFGDRSRFVPPYVRLRARRTGAAPRAGRPTIWTP